MSLLNHAMHRADVQDFLERKLGLSVARLTELQGGLVTRAFEVITPSNTLVFRLSASLISLAKDQAAHERYRSASLPIPAVLDIGRYDRATSYALSERAMGYRFDTFGAETQARLVPALVSVLLALQAAPVPRRDRYGYWSADAAPGFTRWPDYLLDSTLPFAPRGRDRAEALLFREWQERFRSYCALTPDLPHLVHGDFRFANLLASPEGLTGLIDWEESMVGDPLYDLAWLVFWHGGGTLPAQYLATPQGAAMARSRFAERMQCYLLRTGLRSLHFFERSGRRRAYDWTLARLRDTAAWAERTHAAGAFAPAFIAPDLTT